MENAETGQERGAGGTPGGIGEFVLGFVMAVAGGYLLTSQVTVTSGAWALWGYESFGLSLVPLIFGVGILFFNGRSVVGWLLTVAGAVIVIAGDDREPAHLFPADQPVQHAGDARAPGRRARSRGPRDPRALSGGPLGPGSGDARTLRAHGRLGGYECVPGPAAGERRARDRQIFSPSNRLAAAPASPSVP